MDPDYDQETRFSFCSQTRRTKEVRRRSLLQPIRERSGTFGVLAANRQQVERYVA